MPSGSEEAAAAARAARRTEPTPRKPGKLATLLALLSIYSDLKKGKFNMGNYSKLIAAILGNAVGIAVVWLAVHVPFITTCTTAGMADTCTTLGLTTPQLTGTVLAAVNSFFVWWFPPNQKA